MFISFDVGIKNLAYCILDASLQIHQWNCINLCGETESIPLCQVITSKGAACGKKPKYQCKNVYVCGKHTSNYPAILNHAKELTPAQLRKLSKPDLLALSE